MTIRPYDEVPKDPTASPLERETALLTEWNKTLRENARLQAGIQDVIHRPDFTTPQTMSQRLDTILANDQSQRRERSSITI